MNVRSLAKILVVGCVILSWGTFTRPRTSLLAHSVLANLCTVSENGILHYKHREIKQQPVPTLRGFCLGFLHFGAHLRFLYIQYILKLIKYEKWVLVDREEVGILWGRNQHIPQVFPKIHQSEKCGIKISHQFFE